MTERPVYLDFQATTPLDPAVLDAMLPWLSRPGNPHALENGPGRLAANAVGDARVLVARSLGTEPDCVVFTAGATEAANIVLRSLGRGGLAVSAIEHPCVAETAEALEADGAHLWVAGVDADGLVDLDQIADAIDAGAQLVSCMAVNNEVGTIQPLADIAALCRSAGVTLHSDAAQAMGRIRLSVGSDCDVATISGHKIYGPQGIGAIAGTSQTLRKLRPITTGGGQELGLRPGTLPVALCVGLGEACRLAGERMDADRRHAAQCAEAFLFELEARFPQVIINGSREDRVPHNLSIALPGCDAQELLACTPHLALSTRSACASGALAPSRVLTAMALTARLADATIRVGFGRSTEISDAAAAGRAIGNAASALAAREKRRATA